MAELNKTSDGVRLNGEGGPRRDPIIAEMQNKILKDNGSTVTAEFGSQREGYVSSYKMNGTSQDVTNYRINYYPDKAKEYREYIRVAKIFLKVVFIVALLILVITYAIGLVKTNNLEAAAAYVGVKTREIPVIGEWYEEYEDSLTGTEPKIIDGIFPEQEMPKDDNASIYESSQMSIPDGNKEVILKVYTFNIPQERGSDFMDKAVQMSYHNTNDIIFFLRDQKANTDKFSELLDYYYTVYEDQATIQEMFLQDQKGILDYTSLRISETTKVATADSDYLNQRLQWDEHLPANLASQGINAGIVIADGASMNSTILLNIYYTLNEVYEELVVEKGGY